MEFERMNMSVPKSPEDKIKTFRVKEIDGKFERVEEETSISEMSDQTKKIMIERWLKNPSPESAENFKKVASSYSNELAEIVKDENFVDNLLKISKAIETQSDSATADQEPEKIDEFPEEDDGQIFLTPEQIGQLTDNSIEERMNKIGKAIIELSNDKPLHDKRLTQNFWLAVELKKRKGDAITIKNKRGEELKIDKDGSFRWE